MASTYTANLGIEKPGSGEQSGTWGTTTNLNFDIIDRAINGVGAITLSGTTTTLTTSDGSLSDGGYKVLILGGSPSGTNTITISPNNQAKVFLVFNNTNQTATFTQGSGASVNVIAGQTSWIYADGLGSGAIVRASISTLLEDTTPQLSGNLDVNGQSITSASNGNVVIAPNGTGDVQLDADTVRVGDNNAAANIASNGDNDLILKTGNSTTGSMQITDGANGNITLAPNGTGFVGVPNILFSTTATDTNSSNWEIKLSGGNLFFAYNNSNKMKLDQSGNLTVVGDVTASGSL
mgnify:CR=1 FL=1|jgi:hypothetical protein|tara:strand:+ start:757 stop:1635 length:879 start_codon:yes stop_codon:yes gene_type:complete